MAKTINICIAQINPTVGDIKGNLEKVIQARDESSTLGADLMVTSELVITGYPPEDLILKRSFQESVHNAIMELANHTKDGGPSIILGAPWVEDDLLYNSLLFLEEGRVATQRFKHHLPNYGVFDEARVFNPGDLGGPIYVRGFRLGCMICEDMWFSDVSECLQESGAEILISINGSPFESEKEDERLSHAVSRIKETGLPMIYVNQVGGQDELVFDGGSFALSSECILKVKAPVFEESIISTNWAKENNTCICKSNVITGEEERLSLIYKAITLGLRDYVKKNSFPGVLIGLSGGIDSALSAAVAVDALGPGKVRCLTMPSKYTGKDSLEDAYHSAHLLGVEVSTIPIDSLISAFDSGLSEVLASGEGGTTGENIQARIRGIILMALSNKSGAMVLTTGNKSEMSVGYATLYGDMCGGYSVLKDVYKTTVFDLAKWRNMNFPTGSLGPSGIVVPERVIHKKPSAELAYDQFDEDTLPPYDVLDDILYRLVESEQTIQEIESVGYKKDTISEIWNMLDIAEYKRRQAPPGVKLTRKSFGKERRYPITNKFRADS